jgi:hypothetical protein
MIIKRRIAGFVAAALVAGLGAMPALAQKADQTASQFYLAYRAAFDKAKSIDDLLPYMAKKNVDQVKATPEAQRAQMFGMIKEMGALTNVKILKEAKNGDGATLTVDALGPDKAKTTGTIEILKETKNGDGATLTVDALGPDKAKTTGTIEILKESGAWKLGKESWSSGP